ncbi:hypothetical protein TNCV_3666381 [Trichonephila clavipes]|uniref:Uncharacterized protein n=1 Tax=Trichonephila clavipes TaxID=2585209 RepID=A0A8X6VDB2_TRICX|nr:hypothetical protein TNCV_3666381 [Trichonephila clavipes]
MYGPWIHEAVSLPVHVHQLDSIGNKTRQTWQRVSSHQQSSVGIGLPRFYVLPDSRYSRYTREMVILENPNFIATSEMLCPICRAPIITPRSNFFKSRLPAIVAAVTCLTTITDTRCFI